jgi:3-oxoadipate enol-lactonase
MTALVEGTLSRWFTEPYRQREPATMARIGQGIANTPVNGFAGCCAAIAEVDYLDRLKEIKAPALVIVGDQDHGTPPEMAQLIHENLPGSELLVIKDAAHIANIEQEAVFNQALLGFLQRH